ncbi:MAG: TIGR03936 family radical SAM-associated protein, partial [Candidatus Gastranaerophilaceae bacterium]
ISKIEALKYISHLDWQGLLYKSVRKAGIKVAFTQGFNPSPKISLGVALPLFVESEGEYADIEMQEKLDENLLIKLLNKNLPENSRVLKAQLIQYNEPSVDKLVTWAEYVGIAEKRFLLKNYNLECNIKNVLSSINFYIEKKTKKGFTKQIDIRPLVHSIELCEDDINLKVKFIIKTGQAALDEQLVQVSQDSNNQNLASLRADDFLKNLNDEINWDIKRLKLFDKNLKELL